jgi:uncharacterized protein (DUF2384 family)
VEVVRQLFGRLSPRDQEVVSRFYVREQPLATISSEMGLTIDEIRRIKADAKAQFVSISRSQKSERTTHVARPGQTSEAVLAHARETFGSEEKANRWLQRPNHVFRGKTPLEAIEQDPQAVEIELTRIDHGVYI